MKDVVAAGNVIAKTPYKWGGGHPRWDDSGYDCSGSVSFALHDAGLLDSPLVSGDFARWGDRGPGRWITIYANAEHVYMIVAGNVKGAVDKSVKDQPMATLAVAAVLGFVLGALWKS